MKKSTKDLSAKTTTVKGGRKSQYSSNDNMTLVRGAKPAKKDMPAKGTIKGGKKRTF